MRRARCFERRGRKGRVRLNTFGHLFRVTTFGESHGPAIGCVVDGCPPDIAIAAGDFAHDLARRATGRTRHTSARHEADAIEILSGVYEGRTTGTPIALLVRNTDARRSAEHTYELQSLMHNSYAVFCSQQKHDN